MARPREPIELIIQKGKKNLTKAEIEARRASEVQPCTEDIAAPAYLTAAQKKRFNLLAEQLQKIKIMGETDVDALARYIIAQTFYEQAVKDIRDLQKRKPDRIEDGDHYYTKLEQWVNSQDTLAKVQDRYFKQAHTCASALGLTITARCKLEVPQVPEAPKPNKFSKFGAEQK